MIEFDFVQGIELERGNTGIPREEKRANKKKMKGEKKRKAEFSIQSLNYIKNIETQNVAWL